MTRKLRSTLFASAAVLAFATAPGSLAQTPARAPSLSGVTVYIQDSATQQVQQMGAGAYTSGGDFLGVPPAPDLAAQEQTMMGRPMPGRPEDAGIQELSIEDATREMILRPQSVQQQQGGGGATGGASAGGGGSSLVQTMPWIQAQPWIVAELPEPAPSQPSSQPAAQPQIIRPQLPSGPDYPTAPQPTPRPTRQPASINPAPSSFDPSANDWALYPNTEEWRTMTDAERMTAIRQAYVTRGFDPTTISPQSWAEALGQFNERYGMGANPVSWPTASNWRSMNEAQRIDLIRNIFIQEGYEERYLTDAYMRLFLNSSAFNLDGYYSAEYQQYLAQQAAFNAGDIQGYLDFGGSLTTISLEAIYDNDYDPFAAGGTVAFGLSSAGAQQPAIPWVSLSSAGNSLSAAGNSLSLAGSMTPSSAGTTPAFDWYSLSAVGTSLAIDWGGGLSSVGNSPSLAGGFTSLNGAFGTPVTLFSGAGAWRPQRGAEIMADASGALSQFTQGGQLVGFVNDLTRDEIVRVLSTNGGAGLDRLLAQPFNVLLTWGAGAFDIDLHMTGPTGSGDRFHIYFAAPGDLNAFPFAQLIRDCICASGSEVILTTQLIQGGVYRISAFNFGDQSQTSSNLSSQGGLQLTIVRGGVAVPAGNGTTIQGGRVIFSGTPTSGQVGNTWVAVEIDPATGQLRFVNQVTNSSGSSIVTGAIDGGP